MTTKEKILEEIKDINYAYNDCSKYNTIKNLLEEMAEERKKGIWFPRNSGFQKWFRCSECAYRLYEVKGTKFCPNCGADMREEK